MTIARIFITVITTIYTVGFWVYALLTPGEGFNGWAACAIAWLGLMVLVLIGKDHVRDEEEKRTAEAVRDAVAKWETR